MSVEVIKKTFLSLVVLLTLVLNANAQRIKGSDTVLPLSQSEAENYKKVNSSSSVSVTGGGSGVGISALVAGTTDIAQASRKIKFDEKQKLQESGKTAKEVIHTVRALGGDPLCVVVLIDKAGLSEIEGVPIESLIKVSRI